MKKAVFIFAIAVATLAAQTTPSYLPLSGGKMTGPLSAPKGLSYDSVVDVSGNSYGYTLVADGVTDNCSAFNSLEAAVPVGTTLYFPQGYYHFGSTCNSSNGVVLTHSVNLLGDGAMPGWNGTTFANVTKFDAPVVTNLQPNVTVRNIAVDLSGVTNPAQYNTCFSSGAAQTGTMNGAFVDLACQGNATQGHGVLVQSGSGNTISGVWAYNVFHAVAVRSPNTNVDTVYGLNNTDLIVKSASGSGNVTNVNISGVVMEGSGAGTGGGIYITSQGAGVSTTNVNVNNVALKNPAYAAVFETDTTGSLGNLTINNLTAASIQGGCVYAYQGDATGTAAQITVSNSAFTTVAGNCFQNSFTGLTNISLVNTYANGISGTPMVGTFYQQNGSGWKIWTGNASDPSMLSDPPTQGASQIGYQSEYPTGSATFNASRFQFSNIACQGSPGVQFLGSTSAVATRGTESLVYAGCMDNFGRWYANRMEIAPAASQPGLLFTPPDDTGQIEAGGYNAAKSAFAWSVTNGGNANFGGGIQVGAGNNVPVTNGSPTVGHASCIKSAGPPLVIGYCSTQPDASGVCTCN